MSPRSRTRNIMLAVALGAALNLTACGSEGLGGLLVSSSQEVELGEGVDTEIEKEFKIVQAGDPISEWAVELIAPLTDASRPFRDPESIGGYKIEVIADDALINAFAAPGGYVYITTGLVLQAKTCGEIAGVLGHELAHVTERHGVKQLEGAFAAEQIIGFFLNDGLAADTAKTVWGFLQGTKFSREQESEADEVGVQIVHDGGYNPFGLVDFFERILELEKAQPMAIPEFLSSHPATDDRIADGETRISTLYGDTVARGTTQTYDCVGTKLNFDQIREHLGKGPVPVREGTGVAAEAPADGEAPAEGDAPAEGSGG